MKSRKFRSDSAVLGWHDASDSAGPNSTSCIDGPSSQFVVISYFSPTWHGCQWMVDEIVHNQISLNTEGLKCGISPVLNLIHPNPGFGFWEYGFGLVSLHFCSVYTSL